METCTTHPPRNQYQEWGRQIREDDEEAYRRLFNKSYLPLFKYANSFIASHDVCKDVLQETYYKLWQNRKRIDENKSLKAFLYTLVRNECMNHINYNQQHFVESEVPEDNIADEDADLFEPENDDGFLQKQLPKWIKELPDRQREAMELSRYDGLDHEEIAHVMKCAPRTINNHIVLALKTLREKYIQWKRLRT